MPEQTTADAPTKTEVVEETVSGAPAKTTGDEPVKRYTQADMDSIVDKSRATVAREYEEKIEADKKAAEEASLKEKGEWQEDAEKQGRPGHEVYPDRPQHSEGDDGRPAARRLLGSNADKHDQTPDKEGKEQQDSASGEPISRPEPAHAAKNSSEQHAHHPE